MSAQDFVRYCCQVGLSKGFKTFPWTLDLNRSFLDLIVYQKGQSVRSLVILQDRTDKIVLTTFFSKQRLFIQNTELVRPVDGLLRISKMSSNLQEIHQYERDSDLIRTGQIYVNPFQAPIMVEPYHNRLSILSFIRK